MKALPHPIGRVGSRRGIGWLFAASLALAACGGGGGSSGGVTGDPPVGGAGPDGAPPPVIVGSDGECLRLVEAGYNGPGIDETGVNQGEGGGFGDGGGDGGGGDGGGGGIGVGGGLGQFRNTPVEIRNPVDGSLIATGRTDTRLGMVTVKLCGYAGPLEVVFKGAADAQYFDEAKKAFVPFPEGSALRARVPDVQRRFIGATPYTEAAVRLDDLQAVGKSLDDARSAKAVTKTITDSNQRVAAILSDQLPGIYRSSRAGGRFEITGLPVVLNDDNVEQRGTFPDNDRGRYGAANAALGLLAGTYLAGDPTPALTAAEQFARDLSDGRLDLVDVNGCSVASTPAACAGERGVPIAYTYETLWRAKSVATGQASLQAGDDSLAAKVAPVASFTFRTKKSYQSCAFPRGAALCDPLLRVTEADQTVELDSRGRLRITRGMSAPFGDQLRFITAQHTQQIDGDFVEVKVGTQGDVVALNRARTGFLYIEPLEIYEVTGRERLQNFALPDDELGQAVRRVQSMRIPIDGSDANARVANFVPSPAARSYLDGTAGVPPAFLFVQADGNLRGVRPTVATGTFQQRWGSPQVVSLPSPDPLLAVVYDRFVPPAFVPAYGTAPTQTVSLPWNGPRRLYGLTRSGKVKTWLEGRDAPGQLLDVPGVVVQLGAESRAGVYALNSDGQVWWINADQAHAGTDPVINEQGSLGAYTRRFPLHSVQPVPLPERICWIARTGAVACDTGAVYKWGETLAALRHAPTSLPVCGAPPQALPPAGTVDSVDVPRAIEPALKVALTDTTGPIWRLNAAEAFRFERRGTFRQTCEVAGVQFLGVQGNVVDEDAAEGRRSIADTRTTFTINGQSIQANYITGQQLTRALQSASAALAGLNGGEAIESTGPTGFTARLSFQASPGDRTFTHATRVIGPPPTPGAAGPGPNTRPDIVVRGVLQRNGSSTSIEADTMTDATTQRTVTLGGNARSWNDDDLIPLAVSPVGEWQFIDQQAGCQQGCTDERGQDRRWQAMLLGTLETESVYGFRMCWRLRVENASTADIRFACTRHDNQGDYRGITMTDRVLTPDGRLDLIDFGHF